jgi:hypothetical protein
MPQGASERPAGVALAGSLASPGLCSAGNGSQDVGDGLVVTAGPGR